MDIYDLEYKVETYDLNDKIKIDICNKVNKLYRCIESYGEFDKTLKDLRKLYKDYPQYFSPDIISKINSYKESSIILRNKKPLPYMDYSNEYVKNNFKFFNKVKRK